MPNDRPPAEPKHVRNICPVCGEPQLGTHYHALPEEPEDEDA